LSPLRKVAMDRFIKIVVINIFKYFSINIVDK